MAQELLTDATSAALVRAEHTLHLGFDVEWSQMVEIALAALVVSFAETSWISWLTMWSMSHDVSLSN